MVDTGELQWRNKYLPAWGEQTKIQQEKKHVSVNEQLSKLGQMTES
jgi:hypothetical protein